MVAHAAVRQGDDRELQGGELDLEALFSTVEFQEYSRRDPSVQQFRDRGFRHSLGIGVYQAGRLVATLSLLKCDPAPFTPDEVERCHRLPLVEAAERFNGIPAGRGSAVRIRLRA